MFIFRDCLKSFTLSKSGVHEESYYFPVWSHRTIHRETLFVNNSRQPHSYELVPTRSTPFAVDDNPLSGPSARYASASRRFSEF